MHARGPGSEPSCAARCFEARWDRGCSAPKHRAGMAEQEPRGCCVVRRCVQPSIVLKVAAHPAQPWKPPESSCVLLFVSGRKWADTECADWESWMRPSIFQGKHSCSGTSVCCSLLWPSSVPREELPWVLQRGTCPAPGSRGWALCLGQSISSLGITCYRTLEQRTEDDAHSRISSAPNCQRYAQKEPVSGIRLPESFHSTSTSLTRVQLLLFPVYVYGEVSMSEQLNVWGFSFRSHRRD